MYGGEGNDSYMLTQGGVATIVAGSKPGYEVIYCAAGHVLCRLHARLRTHPAILILESTMLNHTDHQRILFRGVE